MSQSRVRKIEGDCESGYGVCTKTVSRFPRLDQGSSWPGAPHLRMVQGPEKVSSVRSCSSSLRRGIPQSFPSFTTVLDFENVSLMDLVSMSQKWKHPSGGPSLGVWGRRRGPQLPQPHLVPLAASHSPILGPCPRVHPSTSRFLHKWCSLALPESPRMPSRV